MTYAVTNPPRLAVPAVRNGANIWTYSSADDDGTVNGSGYFTNGKDLGMKLGDLVYVFDTATPKGSVHFVTSVSAAGVPTLAFAAVA